MSIRSVIRRDDGSAAHWCSARSLSDLPDALASGDIATLLGAVDVKVGTNIRNWGPSATAESIIECIERADASKLDTIWFNDHLLTPAGAMACDDDFADGTWFEIMTTLAFAAGRTSRVRLGTAVLLAPLRPVFVTAKWMATLQALSDRLTVGIGPGWMDAEFGAAGKPAPTVVAMKTLPLEDPSAGVDYAGAFKETGAHQLVHTQRFEDGAHYSEIVDVLEEHVISAVG